MANKARGTLHATKGNFNFYVFDDGFTTAGRWVCDVYDQGADKTMRSWSSARTKTKLTKFIDDYVGSGYACTEFEL